MFVFNGHTEKGKLSLNTLLSGNRAIEKEWLLAYFGYNYRLSRLDDLAGNALTGFIFTPPNSGLRKTVSNLDADLITTRVQYRNRSPHHRHLTGQDIQYAVQGFFEVKGCVQSSRNFIKTGQFLDFIHFMPSSKYLSLNADYRGKEKGFGVLIFELEFLPKFMYLSPKK